VCTLGPATADREKIRQLALAGMDTARLNFSHGDHAGHRKLFGLVREVSQDLGRPIAILQDLQGPKIRVGRLPGGRIELYADQLLRIVCAPESSATDEIPCQYKDLLKDLTPGDRILMDDGRLELTVEASSRELARVRVIVGGTLSDNKGINLPGVSLSTPALTDKDKADLEFGVGLGVDYVALSFVRSAQDVQQARQLAGNAIPLIAKIEKPEAIEAFDQILTRVDGVMVARGDLGVEIGAERVPMLQKEIIEKTNAQGKLIITATEMLDSMRFQPRPTRAEVSDVANAVLDGSDAVMLSGETASGDYPIRAVETMARIIKNTENSVAYRRRVAAPPQMIHRRETTNAIAMACVAAADALAAESIVCYTETGAIALMISGYRPEAKLIAATRDDKLFRRLAIRWGVRPLLLDDYPDSFDGAISAITKTALAAGHVKEGERIIIAGRSHAEGSSDLIKVHHC